MQKSRTDTLPVALDAERQVLGTILKFPDAFVDLKITNPSVFSAEKHQLIFRAVLTLFEVNEAVDITTVSHELQMQGKLDAVGGRAYLVQLIEDIVSPANIGSHANILAESWRLRSIIGIATEAIKKATSQKPSVEIAKTLSQDIFLLDEIKQEREFVPLSSVVDGTVAEANMVATRGVTKGIPTGYTDLDRLTGGFQRGDFVVPAGRPSMGKTALMTCLTINQAKQGYKVGVFSSETGRYDYGLRILCTTARVDSMIVRRGKTSDAEFVKFANAMEGDSPAAIRNWKYWVNDTPNIDLNLLIQQATRLTEDERIDILYIDYLQKVKSRLPFPNKRQETSHISNSLKELATTLNIPIVCLSQLSRSCEQRQNKRPMLADLKETGDIEQDADLVLFLYRHEIYASQKERAKHENQAELRIAKQRNGPTDLIKMYFYPKWTRFEEIEEDIPMI